MTTSAAARPPSISAARAALTNPIRRRSSRASTAPIRAPRTSTVPRLGQRYVAAIWTRVVLPDPFGPTIAQRSPARTVQSTPSRIQRPSRRTPTPVSRTTTAASGSTGPTTRLERPGEQHVRGALGRPAEAHDVAGQLADPGLLLARQLAQLVVEEVQPAAGDGRDVALGQPGDRLDPAPVDPLDRPSGELSRARRARAARRGNRSAQRCPGPTGPPR